MSVPSMEDVDGALDGFCWIDPDGGRTTLAALLGDPRRPAGALLKAHLDALDGIMITAARLLGPVLGGGRPPDRAEEQDLRRLHRTLDRLVHEYATGRRAVGLVTDIRGGQIVGTAHLIGVRARTPLGLIAPAPLADVLDPPAVGMVAGYAAMVAVDEAVPWRGSRWVVRTPDGRRFPARLDMLLRDSSGVDRDLTQNTHRTALTTLVGYVEDPDIDHGEYSGAVDWLLYDWLHAHRDDPSSVAVEIAKGRVDDATMIVDAAAASIRSRAVAQPDLLTL